MYGLLAVLLVIGLVTAVWLVSRARRPVAPTEPEPLQLRSLPDAVRKSFINEWRTVQQRFVDQPSTALGSANSLLTQVMTERGYPVADFDDRAELIGLDHPEVVQNYRIARKIHQSNREKRASTEQLRTALVSYRSLFEQLLTAHPDGQLTAHPDGQQDRAR
ncbi:MAG: hypothetical protein ABIP57_05530 [Jatrophihabitantaceae bacterium]